MDENFSRNHGVEGPTADPEILALRRKQKRNLMATLLLSQGIPMIAAGDEFGRSQRGNNNAYCQDNEISWIDWNKAEGDREFYRFVRNLLRLRSEHPVFRRSRYFHGNHVDAGGIKDILWLTPEGREMSVADWTGSEDRCLAVRFAANAQSDERDAPFLLLMNASDLAVDFALPSAFPSPAWVCLLDTFSGETSPCLLAPNSTSVSVQSGSLVLLVGADEGQLAA